tara:strand:- start:204 stop:350 length:147 start_codon:yes stop_codon:yes gene_type:complete
MIELLGVFAVGIVMLMALETIDYVRKIKRENSKMGERYMYHKDKEGKE